MKDTRSSIDHSRKRGNLPTSGKGRTVYFTEEQFETIQAAINAVRVVEDDRKIPEGRAVELACLDFLSGVSPG
jgi:hypothetical protein